jgi:RNA polymerase sigma-70 factor (ECF subfamily)
MATHAPRPQSDARAPQDEAELVRALVRGEAAAFETLVRAHTPAMLAVARRITRNEEDAREAVQDAFVSVFRSIGRFGGESRLATWLHRIAVNAALMRLRQKRRRPETPIDELLPKFQDDGHELRPNEPWSAPASELAELAETREIVRKAVDELPETYRVALVLRDLEGLETEEVARMLDVTPNAVKIRIHRARQALRAKLDERLRVTTEPR